MHIKLKEYLLLLKEKCEQGNQTPSDFSKLINLIRDLKYDIDDAETTSLLDIVYHVLLEDVELIIENDTWCEQNGDYFAGNMVPKDNDISRKFTRKYSDIFRSKNFHLSIITAELRDIIDNYDALKSDFYLRNPEVVLRDDVRVKDYDLFVDKGTKIANNLKTILK